MLVSYHYEFRGYLDDEFQFGRSIYYHLICLGRLFLVGAFFFCYLVLSFLFIWELTLLSTFSFYLHFFLSLNFIRSLSFLRTILLYNNLILPFDFIWNLTRFGSFFRNRCWSLFILFYLNRLMWSREA